jgi:hypothetical protein
MLLVACILFVLINQVHSFNLNVELNVCVDSERVDFATSCQDNDPVCVQDINYLKNFQDFSDFYIHYKGQIYHAFEDVLYFQTCFKTDKVDAPRVIFECTKDVPVTYIDLLGTNRSGYLNQYEVIRPKHGLVDQKVKRQTCTTGTEKIVYSLPNCLNALVRIGTALDLIPINRIGKPYETQKNENVAIFTGSYKKHVETDINDLYSKLFYMLFGILFLLLKIIVLYFFNCFNCIKRHYNNVKCQDIPRFSTPIKEKEQNQLALTDKDEKPIENNVSKPLYPDVAIHLLTFEAMSNYRELQHYARKYGVKANSNKNELIRELKQVQMQHLHHYNNV